MDAELANELRQLRLTVDGLRQAIELGDSIDAAAQGGGARQDEGRGIDRSRAALFDPLIAWADVNAQLTGRIKELALFERGDPEVGGELRTDDPLAALLETVRATRLAPLEVAHAYKGAGRELPDDLLADVPPDRP